jgi:hypothetical protein
MLGNAVQPIERENAKYGVAVVLIATIVLCGSSCTSPPRSTSIPERLTSSPLRPSDLDGFWMKFDEDGTKVLYLMGPQQDGSLQVETFLGPKTGISSTEGAAIKGDTLTWVEHRKDGTVRRIEVQPQEDKSTLQGTCETLGSDQIVHRVTFEWIKHN